MEEKFKWIIWLQKFLARHGVKYYHSMIENKSQRGTDVGNH